MIEREIKEEREVEVKQDVDWILWHINLCRLFNAKSILSK